MPSPSQSSTRTPEGETRSPRRTPEEKRRSPRIVARAEAAKIAARSLAAAVRERVWAEARTEDGRTYYYHLDRGMTAWELPAGAILRAAGRNSLAPKACDTSSPHRQLATSPHRQLATSPSLSGGGPANRATWFTRTFQPLAN